MEVLHPRWWVLALLLLFAGGARSEELAYIAAVTDVVSVVKPGGVVDDLIPVDGDTPLGRIAITPDGTRAFLIFPLRLSVLDLRTRQIVASAPISGGTFENSEPAFAPDGAVLYITDPITRKISVVDTATPEETAVIVLRTAEPRHIAVAPDGSRLYVSCVHFTEEGARSEILTFDTATRALLARAVIPDLRDVRGDLAISPDGQFVYANAGYTDALYALNTQSNRIEGPFSVGVSFSHFTLSPDGRFAYARGVDASDTLPLVALIDLVSRTTVATIPLPQQTRFSGAPERLQLSPDARRLHLLRPDACALTIIDIEARAIVATVPLDEFATDLAVADVPQRDPTPSPTPTSPPASVARNVCAYASVPNTGGVAVVDVARHELGGFIPIPGPETIALDPNAARAYIASNPLSGPGRLAVVDTTTNSVLDQLYMGPGIQDFALDTRGATLLALLRSDCFGMAAIRLDSHRLERITTFARMSPFKIALRPDGAIAYVSAFNTNAIAIFDIGGGEITNQILLNGVVTDLALTTEGSTLYAATSGPSAQPQDGISVIDVATQRVIGALSLPSVPFALRLSPDGRKLYVSHGDFPGVNTGLAIIDTATLAVTASVPIPNTGIALALAVTPDGAAVYAAVTALTLVPGRPPLEEGRLMVLDATTAAEIAELRLDQPARHIEIAEVPGNCSAPPTPTRTATQTASASPTPTPSGTPTPSPTPTPTRTATQTLPPTATHTTTQTATATALPSVTPSASPVASATPTRPNTVTPTPTALPARGRGGCSMAGGQREPSAGGWLASLLPLLFWRWRLHGARRRPRRRRRPLALYLMAILLLATFRAHAAENPPLPENASAVHLDEVGRPVLPESDTPPARKPPARAAVAPTPAAPLAVQPAPGGGQMIILDDRFRNDSTARRDADGRRTVHCTLGTGAQRTDE